MMAAVVPLTGVVANAFDALTDFIGDSFFDGTTTGDELNDAFTEQGNRDLTYLAFPNEANEVTLTDSIGSLFIQIDEGNAGVPVISVPPAFNADFISEIEIGASFIAEIALPIGELIELPDVSSIVPQQFPLIQLIPGFDAALLDFSASLVEFGTTAIDTTVGLVSDGVVSIIDTVGGLLGDIATGIKDGFTEIIEGTETALNAIIEPIEFICEAIHSIDIFGSDDEHDCDLSVDLTVPGFIDDFAETLEDAGSTLKATAQAIEEDLQTFADEATETLAGFFEGLVDFATSTFLADGAFIATLDGNDTIDLQNLAAPATVVAGEGFDTIYDGRGGRRKFDGETLSESANPNKHFGGPGDDTFVLNKFRIEDDPYTVLDGGEDSRGAGSDGDTLLIELTNTDDKLEIGLDEAGDLRVRFNDGTWQTLKLIDMEKIQIEAAEGDDVLIVDTTHGAISQKINWDGADGTDRVELKGGAVASANEHLIGPASTGTIKVTVGGKTQTLNYEGMDPGADVILDTIPGPLTIQGTPGGNDFTLGETDVTGQITSGLLSSGSELFLKFSGKTDLEINGNSGTDSLRVEAAGLPPGLLESITFNGNGNIGGDSFSLIGRSASDRIVYTPTGPASGNFSLGTDLLIRLNGVGAAAVDGGAEGGAGDALTFIADNVVALPGSFPGTGTLTGRQEPVGRQLLPLTFSNFEAPTTITGASTVVDRIEFDLSSGEDVVRVEDGVVKVVDFFDRENNFDVSDARTVIINLLGGNDILTLGPGNPFDGGLQLFGGAGVDQVHTVASSDGMGLDLSARTLTGVAGGVILLDRVENLTIRGSDGTADAVIVTGFGRATTLTDVTIDGGDTDGDDGDMLDVHLTAGPDLVSFTPTGPASAQLRRGASDPVLRVSGFNSQPGSLIIDGAGGLDALEFRGSFGDDVIVATQSSPNAARIGLSVRGRRWTPVAFEGLAEAGIVAGSGDDLVRVEVDQAVDSTASVRFNVNGGSSQAADLLVVVDDGLGNVVLWREGTDEHSGSVTVGSLRPVVYEEVATVHVTPLDPVSGGTGADGQGHLVVFEADPFEGNDTRLVAADVEALGASHRDPSIDLAGIDNAFGDGPALPGDQDWYQFTAPKLGNFEFHVRFDEIGPLANGQPGLPGDGILAIDLFDADGDLVNTRHPGGEVEATGRLLTVGLDRGQTVFLRVLGATAEVVNTYDVSVVDPSEVVGPPTGDPAAEGPAGGGLQVIDVVPTAEPGFDLFAPKPSEHRPTPPVESVTIFLRDFPIRAEGFAFEALDPALAGLSSHYLVRGDRVGVVPIVDVIVTNDTPVVGQPALATVELRFDGPLPDDRYTLTISDSLIDSAGRSLDGDTNAVEPVAAIQLPSGDGQTGGDFDARFTVDTRPEVGTFFEGLWFVDLNGNGIFDPENSDATHRDVAWRFGEAGDLPVVGDWNGDGFDEIGVYTSGDEFRLDLNGNGTLDGGDLVFEFGNNGVPIAGDWNGDGVDDVGLLRANGRWVLDLNGNRTEDNGEEIRTNFDGTPIAGDWTGTGVDRVGTFDRGVFRLDIDGDRVFGVGDLEIPFSLDLPPAFNSERPVVADWDADGDTNIGLFFAELRADDLPRELSQWYLDLGEPGDPNSPGDGRFEPPPTGHRGVPWFLQDIYHRFGDERAIPVAGNFDPPPPGSSPVELPVEGGDGAADRPLGPVSSTVAGDFDGDAIADFALFRPGARHGSPVILTRNTSGGDRRLTSDDFRGTDAGAPTAAFEFRPGDIPVSGDFDGDGLVDVAVFRPDSDRMAGASEWFLLESGGEARSVLFGGSGLDVPAPADYTGDGVTDIAVFRPVSDLMPGAAQWFILPSEGGPAFDVYFGAAGGMDLPAPADYDGDGKADIAVFRPESDLVPGASQWFILPSGSNAARYATTVGGFSVLFGQAGVDQPVPADYDGDGKADIAAYRPTSADFFILPSRASSGYATTVGGYRLALGVAGNLPAPADYDGDDVADPTVFDPAAGRWTSRRSSDDRDETVTFGPVGSVPLLAPLAFRLTATVDDPDVGTSDSSEDSEREDRQADLFDLALEELGGLGLDVS